MRCSLSGMQLFSNPWASSQLLLLLLLLLLQSGCIKVDVHPKTAALQSAHRKCKSLCPKGIKEVKQQLPPHSHGSAAPSRPAAAAAAAAAAADAAAVAPAGVQSAAALLQHVE